MSLPFIKYQGAGNDFVLLDTRHLDPAEDLAALAIALCDRRKGIGADGLLLLGPSAVADYKMSIFNADGSRPAMCGNGAYCLVSHIDRCVAPFQTLTLETPHALLHCRKMGNTLVLNLGPLAILHFPLLLEDGTPCYVVNTGVPHAVVWTDRLDQVDVEKQGRALRYDPRFAPGGVNVNFARFTPEGILQMRTYERGVEGETLACGTGAAAVAFVAKELYSLSGPIPVATRTHFLSQPITYTSQLQFLFSSTEVEMIGSAQGVFQGVVPW